LCVEHKMGLKVSATCELTLGQHGVPAKGWLVGEVHDGISQMFEVIDSIRRTCWRVFGVLPVEMGATDGVNRATAEMFGVPAAGWNGRTSPRRGASGRPSARGAAAITGRAASRGA
jgi:hypothetical protein